MTLPNFIIVGAVKSGTSSVFRYMAQHPDIFTSTPKEPSFFLFESSIPDYQGPGDHIFYQKTVLDLGEYESLFAAADGKKAIGEASASYLHDDGTAKRIFGRIPEVKIIAILRNPIERAYSHYWMYRASGREKETFADALKLENERKSMNWAPGWQYSQIGLYAQHLQRFFDLFPRRQCHVAIYDDLEANPSDFMRALFRFLEVNDDFAPNTNVRYNVAGRSKSRLMDFLLTSRHPIRQAVRDAIPANLRYKVMTRLRQRYLSKPPMPKECREHLVSIYRDDVARLEKVLDRSLANWLR